MTAGILFAHNGLVWSVRFPGRRAYSGYRWFMEWSDRTGAGFRGHVREEDVVDPARVGGGPVIPVGRWSDVDPCLTGVRGGMVRLGPDTVSVWTSADGGGSVRTVPTQFLPWPWAARTVLDGDGVDGIMMLPVDGYGIMMDVVPVPTASPWGPPLTWRLDFPGGTRWCASAGEAGAMADTLLAEGMGHVTVRRVDPVHLDGLGAVVAERDGPRRPVTVRAPGSKARRGRRPSRVARRAA